MKKLQIPFVATPSEACQVSQVLDNNHVSWQTVDSCNWPEGYPYTPKAEFRIAHTPDAFLLNFRSTEDAVRATETKDNESVCVDSCMEFFFTPNPEEGTHYYFETNCIATVLLRLKGENVPKVQAPQELLNKVGRWSSLGREPFGLKEETTTWETAYIIPFEAFWLHNLPELLKAKSHGMRGNFFKCGDLLPKPHFLSWSGITSPKPNFHLPQFFGELILEQPNV